MEKVLITGISGGQGRLLARRLAENYEVCGVDRVEWEGAPRGVRVHTVDLRKKKFEDVIRTEMPNAIVHMGFVRHFRGSQDTRHDVNVRGTKQLLDHCVHHGVQNLIVISSSYVYGAFPENPYYMDEDSPLSASRSYPEIRDLVEVDTLASAFLWRYPHIRTCVLRPVNVLGYYVHSMIAQYLRQQRVPTVMGFDPMMQFIHEEDVSESIALSLEHGLQGSVTHRARYEQHYAVADSSAQVVCENSSKNDASAARLQNIEITFDHVDHLARQRGRQDLARVRIEDPDEVAEAARNR